MSKILKVSDQTHELVMSLRGDGETVDDVLQRQLSAEQITPVEGAENLGMDSNGILRPIEIGKPVSFYPPMITTSSVPVNIDLEKIASEATPQKVSNRKTAGGGKPRTTEEVFKQPDDESDPEKACCKASKPCQHWEWVGDRMEWRNTLSSRIRQPA